MDINLSEKFIPVSEVTKRAGVGYHTLRYYTKIGLLPYMVRKLPFPGAAATVGHYPESVLETLKKIEELKKQGLPNESIKKTLENAKIAPSSVPTPEPTPNIQSPVASQPAPMAP